jgi:DNA-binding response OmpR family regulator
VNSASPNDLQWNDVALVSWPEAEQHRAVLRDAGLPRLLLVPEGCDPPITDDAFEDWVRTPADPRDVQARVSTLQSRAARDNRPHLDEEGRLHASSQWIALSPIECRLVQTLLDRPGMVTSRATLLESGWPSGATSVNQLHVHMTRLRRRLEPLGLSVRTVYARGYTLERHTVR